METKKWYASKVIISGVIAVIVAVYNSALTGLSANCGIEGGLCVHLPMIPDWIFGILAAFGVYGRVTATTVIK